MQQISDQPHSLVFGAGGGPLVDQDGQACGRVGRRCGTSKRSQVHRTRRTVSITGRSPSVVSGRSSGVARRHSEFFGGGGFDQNPVACRCMPGAVT